MKFNKTKLKKILWDWNGTMLNDAQLCADSTSFLLNKFFNKTITLETYREKFCFPVDKFYESVGFDFSNLDYNEMNDLWIEYYLNKFNEITIQKDLKKILDFIQTKNIDQSILSACEKKVLKKSVCNFNLENYFTNIYGVDNFNAKGKLSLALQTKPNLPYKDEEILLIGDTKHDAEIARELNINYVLVSHGHQHKNRLLSQGEVFDNFQELLTWLKDKI